jgi:hypothetical protein
MRWPVFCARFTAATATAVVALSSGVGAQTLVEPNSKPKSSQPSSLAKPQLGPRTKSCSSFGAGFVQIAGTDACVKIGGYVTIDGTVNHPR